MHCAQHTFSEPSLQTSDANTYISKQQQGNSSRCHSYQIAAAFISTFRGEKRMWSEAIQSLLTAAAECLSPLVAGPPAGDCLPLVLQAVLHKQLVSEATNRNTLAWLFIVGRRKADVILYDMKHALNNTGVSSRDSPGVCPPEGASLAKQPSDRTYGFLTGHQ